MNISASTRQTTLAAIAGPVRWVGLMKFGVIPGGAGIIPKERSCICKEPTAIVHGIGFERPGNVECAILTVRADPH